MPSIILFVRVQAIVATAANAREQAWSRRDGVNSFQRELREDMMAAGNLRFECTEWAVHAVELYYSLTFR